MTTTSEGLEVRLNSNRFQRRAANPQRSVWVSASAGTGKTKVLTDRVLSLLLAGTEPHRILCLTFTRAAAAEMANRINKALAGWAISDDEELDSQIQMLRGRRPDSKTRDQARLLFARVLDVPGGMKIQTIHSFCESLLGRFPLEAGLAPHFEVMDERDANVVQLEAQKRVLDKTRLGANPKLEIALADIIGYINEAEFTTLISALSADRGRIRQLLHRHHGIEKLVEETYTRLGVPLESSPEDEIENAVVDIAIDVEGLISAARAMLQGSKTDQLRGEIIANWLEKDQADRVSKIDDYLAVFFTTAGIVRKALINKQAKAINPAAVVVLDAEAARLEDLQHRIQAAVTAQSTCALLRLADALLDQYETRKREIGRLDYDDLILKARELLETDGGASWVLFKLDGGIDHILIDEAQDTNPDQWAVIRILAEEFFAELAPSETNRTIFAVGDTKQSIYSFQRAAPEEFDAMRAYFRNRANNIGQQWDDINLDLSFRSTASVLKTVDAVFSDTEAQDGLVVEDQIIRHDTFRQGQAGLVEIWPPIAPKEVDDRVPWAPPVLARHEAHPTVRLANVIAGCIGQWTESGEMLESRGRAIQPGDIMILVRRRGVFVEELVRALKQKNIPVAGVDRMVLGEQLAVRDLIALGNFLLLPEDDLTLATVLKGPFFGLNDDDLFELAYGRDNQTLWYRLRQFAHSKPIYKAASAKLGELMASVDFVTPFELFGDLLGRRRGRHQIARRLGLDANDPLDEFLARALAFERTQAPSLQAFLHTFETDSVEVKRDLEQATRNEVRVMTIHGSKGLQAPIVFLPDTLQVPTQRPQIVWTEDDYLIWPPRARFVEPVAGAAIDRSIVSRDQEYRRLLYVAMTRAEDRLYICGWKNRKEPPKGNWYDLITRSMAGCGVSDRFDLSAYSALGWQGEGWRITNSQKAPPETSNETGDYIPTTGQLPPWAISFPPTEIKPPQPLTPSRPDDDEPPLRSPRGTNSGASFRRGLLVHRLLQILPDLAPEDRPTAAERFLSRRVHGLNQFDQNAIAEEVLAVLSDLRFDAVFRPGSRAEVPIVGRIGDHIVVGQVDRLCVTPEAAHIVDYKTNRLPPIDPQSVAPIYLRQMAAYSAVIRQIYPDKEVCCALLWTDGPHLMDLPNELLQTWVP